MKELQTQNTTKWSEKNEQSSRCLNSKLCKKTVYFSTRISLFLVLSTSIYFTFNSQTKQKNPLTDSLKNIFDLTLGLAFGWAILYLFYNINYYQRYGLIPCFKDYNDTQLRNSNSVLHSVLQMVVCALFVFLILFGFQFIVQSNTNHS